MFRYSDQGEIAEITIRDGSGAKIESYKFRISDKQKMRSIMNMLKNKYGLNEFPKKDKDIEWTGKSNW